MKVAAMIKFKRNNTNKAVHYEPPATMVASLSLEREEDGFVMVGETADERNTVKPGDDKNFETPPPYEVTSTYYLRQ